MIIIKKLYIGLADEGILIWELYNPKPIGSLSYKEVKEYIKTKENENNQNSSLNKNSQFLTKSKSHSHIESE